MPNQNNVSSKLDRYKEKSIDCLVLAEISAKLVITSIKKPILNKDELKIIKDSVKFALYDLFIHTFLSNEMVNTSFHLAELKDFIEESLENHSHIALENKNLVISNDIPKIIKNAKRGIST